MVELSWQCVRSLPATWALGEYAGNKITNIRAVVERLPDGSWEWGLTGNGFCLSDYGTEPTRLFAIAAASKANKKEKK